MFSKSPKLALRKSQTSSQDITQPRTTPLFMRRKKCGKVCPQDSFTGADLNIKIFETTEVESDERRLSTLSPQKKKHGYHRLHLKRIYKSKKYSQDDEECYKKRSIKLKHNTHNAVW